MNKIEYTIFVKKLFVSIIIKIHNDNNRVIELYGLGNQNSQKCVNFDVSVESYGRRLNYIKTFEENGYEIVIPSYNKKNIEIRYDIPSKITIGQREKCISKFSDDYYYFISEAILLLPLNNKMTCSIKIYGKNYTKEYSFSCSEELSGICLAGGKNVNEAKIDNIYVSLVNNPIIKLGPNEVIKLFKKIERIMGQVTNDKNIMINIIKDYDVHGGFAGTYSLISEDKMEVLFHELVHIWIGNEISFSDEATPYKEALTEYTSLYLMYLFGFISKAELEQVYVSKYEHYLECGVTITEPSLFCKEMSYPMEYYTVIYDGLPCYFLLIESELRTSKLTTLSVLDILKNVDKFDKESFEKKLYEIRKNKDSYDVIKGKAKLKATDFKSIVSCVFI